MGEEESEHLGPGQSPACPGRYGDGVAIYLFCLARAAALKHVEGLGIDGRSPLFLWRRKAVAALISGTPLADFCGEGAEKRLADLAWVGPRARHHADVITSVMRQAPVLPARFGTLFSSPAHLEKLMEIHQEKILRFFDQVETREEWAVKGRMKKMKIQAALLSRALAGQEPLPAAAGARYLHEQRLRLVVEKEVNLWVRDICRDFTTELARYASDFRNRPVQSAAHPEDGGEMMSNWAFLVPRAQQSVFQERIKEANARHEPQGVCFECSGPWPPYSFVPSLEADLDP